MPDEKLHEAASQATASSTVELPSAVEEASVPKPKRNAAPKAKPAPVKANESEQEIRAGGWRLGPRGGWTVRR